MEIKTTRTLVKSQPELWELLDDESSLRHWCGDLCEAGAEIEVTARVPNERLAWRGAGPSDPSLEVILAEKGFGTRVVISARSEARIEAAALERILDELAQPQRRPFTAA